jgi:hypothetical protein
MICVKAQTKDVKCHSLNLPISLQIFVSAQIKFVSVVLSVVTCFVLHFGGFQILGVVLGLMPKVLFF